MSNKKKIIVFFILLSIGLMFGSRFIEISWKKKLEAVSKSSEPLIEQNEDTLKKKIESHPYSGELHYQLAVVYLKRGDIDNFELELKKALDVDPKSIALFFTLAHHYEEKNQFEKALELYKIGAKYDISYKLPFHYDIARMYQNSGKNREAIENYKEALKHIDSYDITPKENIKIDIEKELKTLETIRKVK